MSSLLTVVSLFVLLASTAVSASPCIAFDVNFNLLALGFAGKDFNAGTQDTWTSNTKASDITISGRPPFDGTSTTCYLSQFENAIYVIGADSANPTSVYIYDATALSWSAQSVTLGSLDPTSFKAILDHDTNVFYALSNGVLFSLDMGQLKAAQDSTLAWTTIENATFATDNYQPVMALAQNHIHFLDVPGNDPGSADIFVIHFSFLQPIPQSYPLPNGSFFPATHGQATSFFQDTGVQQEFAFIPDDGSATYVINVESNTTQALAGPTKKDPAATYFAGITSLVQLDSTGAVSFLAYQQNNSDANQAAQWATVGPIEAAVPPGSATSSASGTSATSSGAKSGGSSSPKPTDTPSSTSAETGGASQPNDGISARKMDMALFVALVLCVVGLTL